MLKLIRFARFFNTTPKPPSIFKPLIITKQTTGVNIRIKDPGLRTWLTNEETAILDQLLVLVKERKFDDLFGSLNDTPSLTLFMFNKVILTRFEVPIRKEIDLKEKVMQIMCERGVTPDAFSITPLISLYGKVGGFKQADDLLKMMKEKGIKRNPTIYTSLMKCHEKDTAKVSDLVSQMIEDGIMPNVVTYTSMIKAFSKDSDLVEQLYRKMIEDGIKLDVVVYSTLIDVYAKNGQMDKAIELFTSMKMGELKPNVFTYTSMIDAYSKDGQIDKAIELFTSLEMKGIKPDVFTYTSMIDAYSKDGQIEKAIELFTSMEMKGIKLNVFTYNSMIDAYSKDGQIEKAIELLTSMKMGEMKPNVVTYTSMIDVYAKNGQMDKALEVFTSLEMKGIKPDVFTYTSMIDAYSKGGQIDKAIELFTSMEMGELKMEMGELKPNVVTYNSMIDAYPKNGRLGKAIELFTSMEMKGMNPDVFTYTSMIDAYSKDGQIDKAIELFTSMEMKGIKPNVFTYTSMIVAYSKVGQIEKAIELLTSMETKGMKPDGSIPALSAYISMIDSYPNNDMLDTDIPTDNLTLEETPILKHLFFLARSRRYDELFAYLNETPSLSSSVFAGILNCDIGIVSLWKHNPIVYKTDIESDNPYKPVLAEKQREVEIKEMIFEIMWKRGVIPTACSFNPLISLYGMVGESSKADALFLRMKKEGIPRVSSNYTCLMKIHRFNKIKVAYLYRKMIDDGVKPNEFIFDCMLNAYCKDSNKIEEIRLEMKDAGIGVQFAHPSVEMATRVSM
jgi:pentatricopeptide repeat protein